MKPTITDGRVVVLHYRLTLDDGQEVDDTFGGAPVTYIQGTGTLVPGLERALQGRRAGERHRSVVSPADGYGVLEPDAEWTVARDQFPAGVPLEPGMSFRVAGAEGVEADEDFQPVWILDISDEEVVLTEKHPLAGENLWFDVQILEVREATTRELEPPDS